MHIQLLNGKEKAIELVYFNFKFYSKYSLAEAQF